MAGIAAACVLVAPAVAIANSWSAPVTASGNDLTLTPRVVSDAKGDTLVVWVGVSKSGTFDNNCPCTVRAAYRPAGGSFGAPVSVSPTPAMYPNAVLNVYGAMDSAGDAVVAYNAPLNPGDPTDASRVAYAAYRPAGTASAFGTPQQLGTVNGDTADGLAMDAAGDAALLVDGTEPYTGAGGQAGETVFDSRISRLPAGSKTFGSPEALVGDGTHETFGEGVAMNSQGETLATVQSLQKDDSHPNALESDALELTIAASAGGGFSVPQPPGAPVQEDPNTGFPTLSSSNSDLSVNDAGDFAVGIDSSSDFTHGTAQVSLDAQPPQPVGPTGQDSVSLASVVVNADSSTLAVLGTGQQSYLAVSASAEADTDFATPTPEGAFTVADFTHATNVTSSDGQILSLRENPDGSIGAGVGSSSQPFGPPTTIVGPNDQPEFGLSGTIDGKGDAAVVFVAAPNSTQQSAQVVTYGPPPPPRPAGPGGPPGPTALARAHFDGVKTTGFKLTAALACAQGGPQCSGQLVASVVIKKTVKVTKKHGLRAGVTARDARSKTKTKTVTKRVTVILGRAGFHIPAGASRNVSLTLNSAGKQLLSKSHKLSVTLTAMSGKLKLAGTRVTMHAPKKKAAKKKKKK